MEDIKYKKNPDNGVIINNDISDYQKILQMRKNKKVQNDLTNTIENLTRDIQTIKDFLGIKD